MLLLDLQSGGGGISFLIVIVIAPSLKLTGVVGFLLECEALDTKDLELIAAASNRYGCDPQYVFGGGGNTSFKTAEHLYVKPSGVELATIQPDQFVKLERAAIRQVFAAQMPAESPAREALVKDMMAATVCPDSAGRPSVEAPLHELLPDKFVVHMHSVLVNGLACAMAGPAAGARLFPEALWIEYVDPGYTLAMALRQKLAAFQDEQKNPPALIILQNHGVFVSGNSIAEIDAHYEHLLSILQAEYDQAGVSLELNLPEPDPATVRELAPQLRALLGTEQARAVVHAGGYFKPVAGPFSPDHIVCARSFAFEDEPTAGNLAAFRREHGYQPAIVAVDGKAAFGVEANLKSARLALEAARNAKQIEQLSQAFGGPRFLNDRERSFIENWEVESYRRKLLTGAASRKRMHGKIALVTGGAQGFGYGIAQGLAAEGATLILADINEPGAQAAAAQLETEFGRGAAFALGVDVGDEASVQTLAAKVLRECGGLDVLIVNAGVLRAGSVKELSKSDWDLVTAVNYTGYFLCVKHLAPVMARQNAAGQGGWLDIVQINSKSGLIGSNRNAAYAGSKFGAIGLTQSFALELIRDRIKVNSICPGNFLDGPLWSDPETGLFVQYLNRGKVPGAKTVEDVRKFYEAKVPMGRGCDPADVVRAIIYVVEQQYETGQAIPVTGGQIMLS